MNVYFRSPDIDGNCLFDDYVYIPIEFPSGESLVFRSPKHPNGGCIFGDPSQIEVLEQRRGGSGGWRGLEEDEEELLTVILAVALRRGYGGFRGEVNE